MNNNLFKYSSRFMTVAVASAMLASCTEEKFDEANALALEKQRLDDAHKRQIELIQLAQKNAIELRQYQRQIDSLTMVDAAGKVIYAVIPVSATTSVFGSGRSESTEGVSGATVTVSQYGLSKVVRFDGANRNGVYTFGDLYSGEVAVTISAAGHTTVNYVANLTPDGPVANGAVVYVGNVVPLFELSRETAKMSVIKARAWIETNLTNGTEEIVDATANSGIASGNDATDITVTAQIDVTRKSAQTVSSSTNGNTSSTATANNTTAQGYTSAFFEKFIIESNDENNGVLASNGNSQSNTRSGFIQRLAYESVIGTDNNAATGLLIGKAFIKDGKYALLSPSSATGLPIKLEFSELAADRTFYRNNKVVTSRHVYGPNVKVDAIENGVTQTRLRFTAVETEATLAAVFTQEVKGTTIGSVTFGDRGSMDANNGNAIPWVDAYSNVLVAPTYGITGGAGATEAITGGTPTLNAGSAGANASVSNVGSVATDIGNSNAFTTTFRIRNTNAGAAAISDRGNGKGYTTAPSVTITRNDVFLIGTGSQKTAGAAGSVTGTSVRVIDGGSGFIPTFAGAGVGGRVTATNGAFTNTLPSVNFAVGGAVPTGTTAPSYQVIIDQTVGAVSFLSVANGGSGYTTPPTPIPTYGTLTVNPTSPKGMFRVATDGSLFFNTADLTGVAGQQVGGAAFISASDVIGTGFVVAGETTLDAQNLIIANVANTTQGLPGGFVFVPDGVVVKTLNPGNGVTRNATLRIYVYDNPNNANVGRIQRIQILDAGSYSTTLPANELQSLAISITAKTNTLSFSNTSLLGSGLNNYNISINPQDNSSGSISTVSATLSPEEIAFFQFTPAQGAGTNPGNKSDITNTATIVGGATYTETVNGVTVTRPASGILNRASYIVVFEAPSANVADKKYSYGVPLYDGTVVRGIRILEAGAGYEQGKTYRAYMIPNAYRGTTAVTGLPTNRDLGAAVFAYETALQTGSTVKVNVTKTINTVLSGYVSGYKPATLTVNVTTAGKGYSANPRIIVYNSAIPTSDPTMLAGAGLVNPNNQQVSSAAGTVNLTAISNTFSVNRTKDGGIMSVNNTYTFPNDNVFGTSAFGLTSADFFVVAQDDMGQVWTDQFRMQQDAMPPTAWIDISDAGKVTAVRAMWNMFWTAPYLYNAANLNMNPVKVAIDAPADPAGTTATGTVNMRFRNDIINVGVAGTQRQWTIESVTIAAGGSGSGYQRGNLFYNSDKEASSNTAGGATGTAASERGAAAAGQNFRIIGGFDSMNGTAGAGGMDGGIMGDNNHYGESNVRFDAFTGIAYVRDIHYGTGKEVE